MIIILKLIHVLIACELVVSVQANLCEQVKRSGRSQNLFTKSDVLFGEKQALITYANLCEQVKRSGRSQNRRLQRGFLT